MDNFKGISIEEEEEFNELMKLIEFSAYLLEMIKMEGFTEISFRNSTSKETRSLIFVSKS